MLFLLLERHGKSYPCLFQYLYYREVPHLSQLLQKALFQPVHRSQLCKCANTQRLPPWRLKCLRCLSQSRCDNELTKEFYYVSNQVTRRECEPSINASRGS